MIFQLDPRGVLLNTQMLGGREDVVFDAGTCWEIPLQSWQEEPWLAAALLVAVRQLCLSAHETGSHLKQSSKLYLGTY